MRAFQDATSSVSPNDVVDPRRGPGRPRRTASGGGRARERVGVAARAGRRPELERVRRRAPRRAGCPSYVPPGSRCAEVPLGEGDVLVRRRRGRRRSRPRRGRAGWRRRARARAAAVTRARRGELAHGGLSREGWRLHISGPRDGVSTMLRVGLLPHRARRGPSPIRWAGDSPALRHRDARDPRLRPPRGGQGRDLPVRPDGAVRAARRARPVGGELRRAAALAGRPRLRRDVHPQHHRHRRQDPDQGGRAGPPLVQPRLRDAARARRGVRRPQRRPADVRAGRDRARAGDDRADRRG